jgi:hypothetical protein
MRDSEYKLYSWHKLDLTDRIDCIEWAKDNFEKYDGVVSPLWNRVVKAEFDRLNADRKIKAAEITEADLLDVETAI